MFQSAAQPIFGSEIQASRFPTAYRPGSLKKNPTKSRRTPGAGPLTAPGQIVRFLLAPEDSAASLAYRSSARPLVWHRPWLGSLKALFWTLAAIGLSLGISSL